MSDDQDPAPCPTCGANADSRVDSAGFGRQVREVCGKCGHDFGTKDKP